MIVHMSLFDSERECLEVVIDLNNQKVASLITPPCMFVTTLKPFVFLVFFSRLVFIRCRRRRGLRQRVIERRLV